jgi:hypothetical protein
MVNQLQPSVIKGVCFAFMSLLVFPRPTLAHQIPAQYRDQIKAQAEFSSKQPVRLILKLLDATVPGKPTRVQARLLNSDGSPVPSASDSNLMVEMRLPSGKTEAQKAQIKKGSSEVEFSITPSEPGYIELYVRPSVGNLRPALVDFIVRAPSKRPAALNITPSYGASPSLPAHANRLVLASFPVPQEPIPTARNSRVRRSPVVHITVGDAAGYYIANGKDSAQITATYESPDLQPAPANIHLWFKWTNSGTLDHQPLQINKGEFSATAHFTCVWPADIHFSFGSSTPVYAVVGDTEFTLHFIPTGVALVGPNQLSLVDNTPVSIVFYDANNNPVAPGKKWNISLHSSESRLHFAPGAIEVASDSPTGSAALLPVAWGADTIEAVVPNYQTRPLKVVVTGWLVVILCLAGGVAGGLAAYNKFKGSWVWRVFLGILGGATLSWLYVYLALPNVISAIAHNMLSAFFVSVIGGYLGTSVLDLAAKRFGWISGSSHSAPESP